LWATQMQSTAFAAGAYNIGEICNARAGKQHVAASRDSFGITVLHD
jgi:hypothetical protein